MPEPDVTPDLTPAVRQRLREMLAKATPGPWTWVAEDPGMVTLCTEGKELECVVLACIRCKACQKREEARCFWPEKDDAALISAGRNHLASLLDAADDRGRLRTENTRLRAALQRIHERFVQADEGTLHVRDGVAWAMDSDARATLEDRPNG